MAEELQELQELQEGEYAPSVAEGEEVRFLDVPIVKAGKGYTIRVDLSQVPTEMYIDALAKGLKAQLNSGMSKLDSTKDMTGTELEGQREAIMAKANENLDKLYNNKLRKSPATKQKSDVPQAVMAEARRIAKIMIKDQIKREGKKKVSLIPAKVLTAAANKLIADQPSILKRAADNIAKRDEGLEDIKVSVGDLEEDAGLARKAASRAKSRKKPSKGEFEELADAIMNSGSKAKKGREARAQT